LDDWFYIVVPKENGMDWLIQNGIDWIVAIQSLGGWLEVPMGFFTFLGMENFFFLVLPMIYWSIDAGLGLRVALILAASNNLKPILKMLFAGPRPYWVSSQVEALSAESSFGSPSGHAQDAASLWGAMAAGVNKRWAWIAAFVLTLLIGWLVGYAILFIFLRFWDPVAAWLKTKTLGQQVLVAFLVSVLMIVIGLLTSARLGGYVFPVEWEANALRSGPLPDPDSIESVVTGAGSLFGLAAGAAWIASRGGYQAAGPVEKRALRYVIGLIGIMILWFGLGEVFPRGEELIPLILRYLRYSLVGFWVMGGAPWLFFRFNLAEQPKIQVGPLL
jgi:hypothetical protein